MTNLNSLYVINRDGEVIDRYDKRFCTGGDLQHYSPGDHFVTFDVNDVRCGHHHDHYTGAIDDDHC